ncbi:MarR family winged helix-turn-helix transcriptional regulator [Thiolinea disciformis]|uniref:MarR family winged helix-turn-helix transcriptional regulator n=1 Tax=Thiolinea disciformis TaxID=125614 RepID=UPI000365174F|nr:MarR family transcriptional regulator [Thiolinea disciformis]
MTKKTISASCLIQNALIASRLARKVENRLSVHGLSFTEYLVMDYLDNAPHKAVPRIALAEHVGMSASGVTRLLAPMEKNHLVDKVANQRDARQSLVKLSETGQRVFNEASVSFENIAKDLLVALSTSQQERLVDVYAKLI